jgi:hypothetical protein
MRQFDPAHRTSLVPTSVGRLERGSMTKALLTIPRKASEPLTVRSLTRGVASRRGTDMGDRKIVERTTIQVRTVLVRHRKSETAVAEPGPMVGAHQAWSWRIAK